MAKNEVYDEGNNLEIVQAGVASGDPIVAGQVPGVALTSSDASNRVTMKTNGVFTVSVKGIDGGGNSAVAVGDIIYRVDADTPKLSKKTTGVRFGYALEAVVSGATTAIRVKLGY
jgi:predicted RecA/RadA family phage recombinase